MMLLWIALVVAIIWGVWMFTRRRPGGGDPMAGHDRAEQLLRERYARGEMDEETFRRMLDELRR